MSFTLSSPTISEGAEIPTEHTCDGADSMPTLAWTGAPAGTAELLLLMDDPDANGFVHWLVAGIPAAAEQLGAGVLPAGARELVTSFGRAGYGGPCPPSGTHRYQFTLYALSAPASLAPRPSAAQVRSAVGDITVGQATLNAHYTRQGR